MKERYPNDVLPSTGLADRHPSQLDIETQYILDVRNHPASFPAWDP